MTDWFFGGVALLHSARRLQDIFQNKQVFVETDGVSFSSVGANEATWRRQCVIKNQVSAAFNYSPIDFDKR